MKRLMTTKLEPRSDKHYFIGYPKETKGYYFYSKSENKVFVARTAVFLEKEFLSKGSGSEVVLDEVQNTSQDVSTGDIPNIPFTDVGASGSGDEPATREVVEEVREPAQEEDVAQSVEPQVEHVDAQPTPPPRAPVLRRSKRVVRAPERYMGLHEVSVLDTDEPLTYAEAMDRPDSDNWQEAMKSEMQSMYDNKVWDLVSGTPSRC